jgi:hypothetical protein
MRIRRQWWIIIGVAASAMIVAAIPMVHPLEFAHGDIFIQGFFPARGGPQGFHHFALKDSRGELIWRAFELRIGPFAWDLTLNYFHS